MRRGRELNTGPPALQANTLCKEPFERRYRLLFGTSACTTTIPQNHLKQSDLGKSLDPTKPIQRKQYGNGGGSNSHSLPQIPFKPEMVLDCLLRVVFSLAASLIFAQRMCLYSCTH
jgi:hypothetical protein